MSGHETIDAGVSMIAAGSAQLRAETAQTEARLHLLRAAAALERAGDYKGAKPILAQLRKMQKQAGLEVE